MKGWHKPGASKSPQYGNEKKNLNINGLSLNQKKEQKPVTLQQQYEQIHNQLIQKQTQLHQKQKYYGIEILKNQKLKDEIQAVDRQFQMSKLKITLDLLQKNKNNKESPLFYNQNGLCPFELMLLSEEKYQVGMGEAFICMICYQDLQDNQVVVKLPCEDKFHKDCVVQHLLGSKFCPNCTQIVDVVASGKKKAQKANKNGTKFNF